MAGIHFRSIASGHVEAAQGLLTNASASNDLHRNITYACLELRMAIEALVYELFQIYEGELSAGAMKKWTPKQVLDELTYLDDEVDKTRTITISKGGTNEIVFEGEDKRMSARWASKSHNALGNFLHQRTMLQIQTDSNLTSAKAEQKAKEILAHLQEVLSSPVASFRAHRLVKFSCRCGHQIARDVDYLKAGKSVGCSQCGCGFDYSFEENGSVQFKVQGEVFECRKCAAKNVLLRHELANGAKVSCCECGASSVIFSRWVIHYLEDNKSPGASAIAGS